jgi:predicted DNA-binding transcriptional regulator AlpA
MPRRPKIETPGQESAKIVRVGGHPNLADSLAYPPRAMRADRAAAYLGMSTSSFLRLVGTSLPNGVPIGGMIMWDRLDLDAAFENLKNPEPQSENTMHKILGIKP